MLICSSEVFKAADKRKVQNDIAEGEIHADNRNSRDNSRCR